MRIIHVITRLIVGGAQENTLLTCAGLHARGHEVTLITGPPRGREGSLLARAALGGYRVIELASLRRNPHPWADERAYGALKKHFRQLRPDVVHTHSSKAGILGRAAAWNARVPVIVHTIHGLPFHPYQPRWINAGWILLERWAAKRCHALVSVADAITHQALQAGIGRPADFTTIYSGMEIGPFFPPPGARETIRRRLGLEPEKIVLGTIARLQPLKGHDDILAIVPALLQAQGHLHFLWIGDGAFHARFVAAIAANHWQGHFTLTGLVTPEQVAQLVPAMDILVHPSYREGLPRAVVQGLLAGVPAVVYNCDGAAEICIPDRTGVLVAPGDTTGLREAILRLAGDAAQRRRMGEEGKRLAASQFDAKIMVERLEALYKRMYRSPV